VQLTIRSKGKVERMVRELKESFLPWLSGQVLPLAPTIDEYDALARRWIDEIVLGRTHRTTGRIVGEAWADEQPQLTPLAPRVLASFAGDVPRPGSAPKIVDLALRRQGEQVQVRDLAEYEVAL
jgi:hypothetical protein